MSWMTRCRNVFRRAQLNDELDEELASHIEEATERGRSPEEARRAFGAPLRYREQMRDIRLLPWLGAFASDVVFGWRQLNKHRAASAVAILSLALAIGAATAAFRLVDAVLLRTLPVAEPERLFFLVTTFVDSDNQPDYRDILQTFIWQDYDLAPRFPKLIKFLDFWSHNLDGPLASVRVAHTGIISPVEMRYVGSEWRLH